jgi:peroxiredoxin|tara:strand:- start:302 stop:436 length:135 start_codon:yes stop_codon:yes gene_type:complete
MAAKLGSGEAFPEMELPLVGGGSIALPLDLKTSYSVILFYRGHW